MATIPYITGFNVKPSSISGIGIVTFTDGTNDITPNQLECEAYGYTYDRNTGTCSTLTFNTNLGRNIGNINNTIKGGNNNTETGTDNNLIIGESNTIKSTSRNNLVVGTDNEIASGINNTTVLGLNGKATTQAEFAIGGGIESIADSTDATTLISKRKRSVIELAGVTIDNTATNLTVSGDGSSFISVEPNSIIGYDIYITRLELGGTAGTAGNYSYRNIRGAVKIDNSRTMSFIVGFNRNIAKVGINATCVMAESTVGSDLSISVQVTDRNNVTNLWSASVTLHEVISTTTF
tara:strand:- start:2086 stop:2964 length:879 start_codon:yes stop_codon:yes gene_type:complete